MPCPRLISFCGLLLFGAAAVGYGQSPLKPDSGATPVIDTTKTAQSFNAEQRPTLKGYSDTKQPELNKRMGAERATIGDKVWNGKSSDLLNKKARWDTSQTKEFKSFNYEMLDYGSKEYRTKEYVDSKKIDPRYDKATQRDNYMSAKYRDAVKAHIGPTGANMVNFSKQLSMRDINRYQFRKSDSAEGGLPVQVAGAQGPTGTGRPVEYTLFSNYDSKPRSSAPIREAPLPASVLQEGSNARPALSGGGKGFNPSASQPPAPGNKVAPGTMIPRATYEKMGKPVQGEWKATSRVLD